MDARSFRALFEETNPGLIRLLVRGWTGPGGSLLYLESLTEAEDVAAETWRVFLEHCTSDRFDETRPATPYIHGIAKNIALARIKKAYRRHDKSQSLQWFFELSPDSDCHLDEPLLRAIERLEEPEKSILQGKREGVPEREIGQRLGLSRDQIHRRYVRALRQIRHHFIEEGLVSESFESLELAR